MEVAVISQFKIETGFVFFFACCPHLQLHQRIRPLFNGGVSYFAKGFLVFIILYSYLPNKGTIQSHHNVFFCCLFRPANLIPFWIP